MRAEKHHTKTGKVVVVPAGIARLDDIERAADLRGWLPSLPSLPARAADALVSWAGDPAARLPASRACPDHARY